MKKTDPPLYNQTLINTGRGPTVILLHGLFGNYRMWSKTVEALQNDFHVVVPRLPLFDLPVQNTNIKHLVKVLQEFIDWHGLTDVTLVGHAIGGQVALMYSHIHPENVSKLVLTGSTGLLVESPLTNDSLTTKTLDREFVHNIVGQAFHDKTPLQDFFKEEIYLAIQNIPKRLVISSLINHQRQVM